MHSLALSAIFFQDTATLANDVHSMMIAQWIIAGFCVLVLLGALIAVVVVLSLVRKVEKKVEDTTKMVQAKAFPIIAQGQELLGKVQEMVADLQPKINGIVTDLQPKIASVSADVQHISNLVRSKVDEAGQTFTDVNGTVQDVNGKTRTQVARVNGIVTDALTATEQISRTVQHGIRVPINKIASWVAAAKTSAETLGERLPFLNQVMPTRRTRPTPPPVSTARPTGTAATGGPPFVPAPDRVK